MENTSVWCDQVNAQLERILKSAQFAKSNRLGRLLAYVVQQTLINDSKTIRSYNIAVEVFGKGPSFDPADPYVRNIARLTRQALKDFYATAGADDKVRIDVPAGNYIATFAIAEDTSVPQASESRSCAISGGVVSEWSGEPYSASVVRDSVDWVDRIDRVKPSVAVIPFKYPGDESDGEQVIGEILASGLIAGLSKSPQLNVISWLSTTQFRNSQDDVLSVSRSLSCDYVVSGSYQCIGTRLSVFVEIADSNSLEVILAEVIHSTVSSLLSSEAELINELTSRTARVVLERVAHQVHDKPLESLGLHAKLISGMLNMHSGVDQQFLSVRTQFNQILARYPKHPTVNALLAQWYVLKINRGGGWQGVDDNRNRSISQACLNTALETSPTHPLALTMQGLVETQFNNNPEKGLSLYDSAEHYNPSEPVLMAYKSAALSYKGQAKEAIGYAKKAFTLSPFDPQLSLFHTCAAAAYYTDGDCDTAVYHADCAYELNPAHTSNLRTLVAIQIDLGNVVKARISARLLLSIDPGFTTESYLRQSPGAAYKIGQQIADRLEQAGIPAA